MCASRGINCCKWLYSGQFTIQCLVCWIWLVSLAMTLITSKTCVLSLPSGMVSYVIKFRSILGILVKLLVKFCWGLLIHIVNMSFCNVSVVVDIRWEEFVLSWWTLSFPDKVSHWRQFVHVAYKSHYSNSLLHNISPAHAWEDKLLLYTYLLELVLIY